MQPLLYTNLEPCLTQAGETPIALPCIRYCVCLSTRLDQVIYLLEHAPHDIGLRFLKALLERNIPTRGAQKASAA